LFSATQTKELKELARAGMRNPVKVTVQVTRKALIPPTVGVASTGAAPASEVKGKTVQQATPSSLENNFMICPFDERPLQLSLFIMRNLRSKIIVFCSTCACVDYYSEIFSKMTKTAAGQKKTKAAPKLDTGSEGEGKGEEKKSVAVPSASSSYLPSCINTLGFHGKMVPKKRALLYKKFQSLSSGVLFCTDIAARGIDFPDIDFIVQLSAPKGRVL
jgi:ATP-dependent RNA helicase DDX55/SPB4